jgi:hypothetical protein
MKVESNVKSGIFKCNLVDPGVAKSYCPQMGQWDIAKIAGKTYQYGPGYGCKQAIEGGPVTHALCK